MLKLSLDELKQIAKMRGTKGYKSMSEERLISSINESKPAKKEFGWWKNKKKTKKILLKWEIDFLSQK